MRIYFSDKSHAKSVASSFKKKFSTVYHPENHQRTLNDFAVLVGYRNYKDLISVTRQESSVVLWSPDEINLAVQKLPDYNQGILTAFCCRYLSQWPRGHYMTPTLVDYILNGKHDIILSLGPTGTGKSTAIQEVASILKSNGLKAYFIGSVSGNSPPVDCEIRDNAWEWRVSDNGFDDFRKFDVGSIEGARARGEVYLATKNSFNAPPLPDSIQKLVLQTGHYYYEPLSSALGVLDGNEQPLWYSGIIGREASSLIGGIKEGVILVSQDRFMSPFLSLASEVNKVSCFYKRHPGYIRFQRDSEKDNDNHRPSVLLSREPTLEEFTKIRNKSHRLETIMFDGGIIYSVQHRSKGVVYIAALFADSCEDAYQKWKSLNLLKGLEDKPVLSIHRAGISEIDVRLNKV